MLKRNLKKNVEKKIRKNVKNFVNKLKNDLPKISEKSFVWHTWGASADNKLA